MKLAVFDFDSTLMDGETINLLAQAHGSYAEVCAITKEAMGGKMDFHQSLKLRVATLKGMPITQVQDVCSNLQYNPGAQELIKALQARHYYIVVFSGGFDEGVRAGAEALGYHIHFSNKLHHEDGILTGEVGGEMMFSYSKGRMLEKIQTLLNVTHENTIAIGDGANDASMFPYAKKRVAFCAKPILKEAANIIIEEKNLIEIVQHLD